MPLPKNFKLADRELYSHEAQLSKAIIKVRTSFYEWGRRNGQRVEAKRPATNRSVHWLHNQIEQQGGTGHFTSLIEYGWDDLLKIFFDIDIKSVTAPNVPALKRQIIQELLQPFFRFVYAKTGVTVDMGNVACSDDTRKTDEGYKFSMHIFINNVVCSAQSLKHLHSILDLPEWVDVKPYDINTPDSMRLLRLLGASKTGNNTYMKPCSLLGPNLVHPPHHLP